MTINTALHAGLICLIKRNPLNKQGVTVKLLLMTALALMPTSLFAVTANGSEPDLPKTADVRAKGDSTITPHSPDQDGFGFPVLTTVTPSSTSPTNDVCGPPADLYSGQGAEALKKLQQLKSTPERTKGAPK